jgi:antitoxin HigA-1
MRKIPYPHPGEILLEEFLKPMVISQYRLAKEIGVSQRRVGEIVAGTRGVTADTGLRLSRFFGMSDGFWTGLQMDHDAAQAKDVLAKTLAKITPWTDHSVVAQQQVPTNTLASASLRQGRRGT